MQTTAANLYHEHGRIDSTDPKIKYADSDDDCSMITLW